MVSVTAEIQQLISQGRFELTLSRSNHNFQKAADLAKIRARESGADYHCCLLGKEAYSELALNETRPNCRTKFWMLALAALKWREDPDPHLYSSSFADLAVDIFQDPFSDYPSSRRSNLLKQAKSLVEVVLNESGISEGKAISLGRKSAIIRLQALGLSAEERLRLLSEASRCSSLARSLSQKAPILLECALVDWALARLQKNDIKYNDLLQSAEEILKLDAVRDYDLGAFTLTRFYRLTFRYYDACVTFPQLNESATNRRRTMRNSAIFAEAAIQLHNLGYPTALVEEYLAAALSLLETAIASGCGSAREIIALATIRCIKEGVDAGSTALGALCLERAELSWEQALRVLSEAQDSDLPVEGFALGVNEAAALTRLGTFANRFLGDGDLAEALYRAAVRMDPHDPIAQTNLARFLVRRGSISDLREAGRIIQLAQTFSDRRFSWWRLVLVEFQKAESGHPYTRDNRHDTSEKKQRSLEGVRNLREIRLHYRYLKTCNDEQHRGYELERVLYCLSALSGGFQRPSYRMQRPLVGRIHQIDAGIEHRNRSYRVECKWQAKEVSYGQIVEFADKIDAVGVYGLFVSISGFSEAAINKAKEFRSSKAIILMDGEEVDLIMDGATSFDDVLNAKRRAFDLSSDIYHPVRVSPSDG